ncbi:hypothetical protein [Pseudanabaena sp. SR411]|uniref:hypothetical protein n=1 Tax=Pseudanabaena sp. SR411 TaxID=1980935 RepID=UPI0015963292|nr:hypothetical protein [Pseudanabaena sp. SR411]
MHKLATLTITEINVLDTALEIFWAANIFTTIISRYVCSFKRQMLTQEIAIATSILGILWQYHV